jgi:hypothetical protein
MLERIQIILPSEKHLTKRPQLEAVKTDSSMLDNLLLAASIDSALLDSLCPG